jgi:hypothetical protein
MLKKPETPPIDLSAKRGTIPKSSEAVAPVAQSIPAAVKPVEAKPIGITPVVNAPVEHTGVKAGAQPCEEDVRIGAYYRWDAAGRPEGDGVHFWLEAEQEIMAGGAIKQ